MLMLIIDLFVPIIKCSDITIERRLQLPCKYVFFNKDLYSHGIFCFLCVVLVFSQLKWCKIAIREPKRDIYHVKESAKRADLVGNIIIIRVNSFFIGLMPVTLTIMFDI